MPTIIYVQPDGDRRKIAASDGESVMQVATANLVPGIVGECGGDLSCSTCHVFVDAAWFDLIPPRSEDEIEMLEAASEEPTEHSRLSCQIRVNGSLDGLVVNVPASQR
jgi:ferredoxin, 2Fe-2S